MEIQTAEDWLCAHAEVAALDFRTMPRLALAAARQPADLAVLGSTVEYQDQRRHEYAE